MGRRYRWPVLFLCAFLLLSGQAAARDWELVPLGQTAGLELQLDGVYVVRFDPDREQSPAGAAGLRVGDRILSVGGVPIRQAADLQARISAAHGEGLVFLVARGNRSMSFTVRPASTAAGWRIGVYVQDRILGLGTLTFYDPATGVFGALGHGVSDTEAHLLPFTEGVATEAAVIGVRKGAAGSPGELQGSPERSVCLGLVEENTAQGIFGRLLQPPAAGRALPVASRAEITTGPAEIWSNVEGTEVRRYEIEIEGLSFSADRDRNLQLRVTDEALLARTGGIVQGMSGSPIIQNGKLVGAVTHVLVRDPSRGYGILIEHMLEGSDLCREIDAAAA